jgi:acetolactate synthase-1/2/3 large subunit
MKPQQVVEALDKITNGDAIITSDVGQHQMFGANYYKYKRPRQWINSGGLGTMGVVYLMRWRRNWLSQTNK